MSAVNDNYSVTVTIGASTILVNSVTFAHSMNSALPTASLVVGNAAYVYAANYADALSAPPKATVEIKLNGATLRTLKGIIPLFSGSEDETGVKNTLTMFPSAYYATFLTSNFDGTATPSYVVLPYTLMQAIVNYFNASVFPGVSALLPSALSLGDPIYNGSYSFRPLQIAPRFMNMSCYDMLSRIAGQYGLSVFMSWDDKVYLGSAVAPYNSGITISKNQLKQADFSVDINNAVYGLASTGWLV